MTVLDQTTKVIASGNGAATTFSFSPMVILEASDLEVTHIAADGTETLLAQGSGDNDYAVVVGSYPGTGSIVYPVGAGGTTLPTGDKLAMKRVLVIEQTVELQNQGGYFPDIHETEYDKLTMMILQLQEQLDRAVKGSIGDGVALTDLPVASLRASKFFAFDASGQPIMSAGTGSIASAFWGTVLADTTLASSLASMGFSANVRTFLQAADDAAMLTDLGVSAFMQTMLTAADAATARGDLGLGTLAVQDASAAAFSGTTTFTDGTGIMDVLVDTLAINSTDTLECLHFAMSGGGNIPVRIDSYGHLHLGDLHAAFPNLVDDGPTGVSWSLNKQIGPALRIYGDIAIGDVEYFGATSVAATEVQQIGVRLKGAFPSDTHLLTAEAMSTDSTGGASIILSPDSGNAGVENQGGVQISAHGSGSHGTYFNSITFWTRSGVSARTLRWQVNDGGTFVPGANATYDIGQDTVAVSHVYSRTFAAPLNWNPALGTAAAIATNAVAGMPCLPTCPGTPTGGIDNTVKAAGTVPMVFDTTNNKLWIWNGTWKGVVVA